jgi:hypothetical protein
MVDGRVYNINEGTFVLPELFRDDSVNVFSGVAPGFTNTSLMITRGRPDEGQDGYTYATGQLQHFRQAFAEYRLISDKTARIADRDARIIEHSWQSENGPLQQLQVCMPVRDLVLINSRSKMNERPTCSTAHSRRSSSSSSPSEVETAAIRAACPAVTSSPASTCRS